MAVAVGMAGSMRPRIRHPYGPRLTPRAPQTPFKHAEAPNDGPQHGFLRWAYFRYRFPSFPNHYIRRQMAIEAEKAKERSGVRTDLRQTFATGESGRARDKAAEQFGISGEQARKTLYVADNADLLDPADFADWDEKTRQPEAIKAPQILVIDLEATTMESGRLRAAGQAVYLRRWVGGVPPPDGSRGHRKR